MAMIPERIKSDDPRPGKIAPGGIVCETRGGFHASFGRAKPCTLVKEGAKGEDNLSRLGLLVAAVLAAGQVYQAAEGC